MLMDELAYFMDWDLEAVVRGCSSIDEAVPMEDPFLNFSHNSFFSSEEDDMFFSFPEFSESTRVTDELEELYKPFYPVLNTNLQPIIIPKGPAEQEEDDAKVAKVVKVLEPSLKVAAPQELQQVPPVSKSKRSKKSLNKKVVKQVTAADIGVCDAWAWRKYGQKPIKGSPYPRSYYRCSSSKGCLARKQVERNHLDPGVFLVAYTGEHNHPHPTRRNSLAGSTRKNNSIVALTTAISVNCDGDKNNKTSSCSSSSSSNSSSATTVALSPRTPLVVQSMEDRNDEIVTTISSNKGLKEEEDFVDDADQEFGNDYWFPSTESIDEMMGFDYQQLEIEIDGSHFMDGIII